MPSLGNFLQGYETARQGNMQADTTAIQQAGALQALNAKQQAAQQEMELRKVVAQSGGDPAKAVQALINAGTPQSIALAEKLKGLMPKPAEPFTLSPGAQRFDASGKLISTAPFAPQAFTLAPGAQRIGAGGEVVATNPKGADATPVTPVTIADPADPTGASTIVIDGRTKRVLGKGPKLTQTGSADQKLVLGMPQARLRVGTMIQNIDKLDTALAELDADPGLPNITGTIMGRTPNITNTATGAQAKLDSIKSQIFQSSLQSMREASKTGGAVGNVSDREGDKLERTIAALDQAQGTPAFKDQLKKARQQLKLSKELIANAFEEQYSGVQGQAASQNTVREFPNEAAAAAAGLAPGTKIKINGISGTWR